MIPVSLWPFALGLAGAPYAIAATILSLAYLWYTILYLQITRTPETDQPDQASLRDLRAPRASVIYLPLLLAAMMLDAQGRLLF